MIKALTTLVLQSLLGKEDLMDENKKILSISKRNYATQAGDFVEVTVVLVAGKIGDYAAYIGVGSPEWIMRYGDKISYYEACIHFPIHHVGLQEDKYRK